MNSVKTAITYALFLFALTGCTDFINNQSNYDMAEIEYGRKLVLIMGCNDCHTPKGISGVYGPEEGWLVGKTLGFNGPYGTLYPTNLRLLIDEISEDEWGSFAQRMRQDSPMAWSRLPRLNIADLQAIYRFIKYLGPKGIPAPAGLPPEWSQNQKISISPYLNKRAN